MSIEEDKTRQSTQPEDKQNIFKLTLCGNINIHIANGGVEEKRERERVHTQFDEDGGGRLNR